MSVTQTLFGVLTVNACCRWLGATFAGFAGMMPGSAVVTTLRLQLLRAHQSEDTVLADLLTEIAQI